MDKLKEFPVKINEDGEDEIENWEVGKQYPIDVKKTLLLCNIKIDNNLFVR
jgi:hypothetical protein